jgi:hypothetical protein
MMQRVTRVLVVLQCITAFGCAVDAVVGVAGPSDGGAKDGIDLVIPSNFRDGAPDGPTPLGGPSMYVCSDNDACPAGAFCWARSGCLASGVGQCAVIPSTCTDGHGPVCGCDGKSYENSCLAYKARTSIQQLGDCP